MCHYAVCLNAITDHVADASGLTDQELVELIITHYNMLTLEGQEALLQTLQGLNACYIALSLAKH